MTLEYHITTKDSRCIDLRCRNRRMGRDDGERAIFNPRNGFGILPTTCKPMYDLYLDHNSFEYLLIITKGPGHATEGQEVLTTNTDDGHEHIQTAADIGQTHWVDRPSPRHFFRAQDSVQERRFSPPELENDVLKEFELGQNYVEVQEDNSDCASTKSSSNRTWEQIITMQEQSHERELIDLLEDIEALKAKHQEDIDAANSKKTANFCRSG